MLGDSLAGRWAFGLVARVDFRLSCCSRRNLRISTRSGIDCSAFFLPTRDVRLALM